MSDKSYEFPEECYYTESDEWIRLEDDVATIGISDFAQSELSDIVFVELPELESELSTGDNMGVIESVKAVGDLFAPLPGQIVEVNSALEENPEWVNEEPYGRGWIVKMRVSDPDGVTDLLSAEEYAKNVAERSAS